MANGNGVTPADLQNPLINEPAQSNPPAHITEMGPLEGLVGTWTNKDTSNPYSYNIMPLPSASATEKYILKNFKYYEEITFSPINGNAPNRGGDYNQNANVLFYEQRIYFADGPDKDKLVHAENGSWLFLETGTQAIGPYGTSPTEPTGIIPNQPAATNIAKQISVPHGNSILAQGGAEGFENGVPNSYVQSGAVSIPDYPASQALPMGVDVAPYATQSVGNPFPSLNNNPSKPLQDGAAANPSTSFIKWSVSTESSLGSVTNIPFEKQKANVTDYKATYWLQALNGATDYTQLAYTQTIYMDLPIGTNNAVIRFPHITCNTLVKKD